MTTLQKDDKAWKRFLSSGDSEHCSGCGAPFQFGGERTLLGYGEHRRRMIVGECCANKLKTVVALGLNFTPEDPWMKADREWFAANPQRSHRVRRAFSGEGDGSHVAVKQVKPGFRLRLSFDPIPSLPVENLSENDAWALFDTATKAGPGAVVSLGAIAARRRLLNSVTEMRQ